MPDWHLPPVGPCPNSAQPEQEHDPWCARSTNSEDDTMTEMHPPGKPMEDERSAQRPQHDGALPNAARSASDLNDRPGAFFSALLTEHFVLESARSITVSESSSRAALYLTTLSSSLVAFGFLADTEFAAGFLGIIVPVVLLLGIFTYERLVETSLEDVAALAAIQRIRRYYRSLLPGADSYFMVPRGRHAPNELLDIGRSGSWRRVFFTMSSAIAVVNSIVAGAGVALLLNHLRAHEGTAVGVGMLAATILAGLHWMYQVGRYAQMRRLIDAYEATDELID